ncbi:hypothetical protein FKW77_000996 [Venturia effusa]|uniref:Ribosomal protein L9 domain-containing protein n=1 Tax=Venturia effusa TaxID=50376 RepID=A0A517LI78_9PEZI|nr:hypothetical protein FKW77_000996 [Venturia effusa]
MSARLRPSLIPRCLSCARSYLEAGATEWKPLFCVGGQTRGISKNKNKSIAVRLLKPMAGYGEPDRYVHIAREVMRNRWFPKRIARYAVGEELKRIKDGAIVVERDYGFKIPSPSKSSEPPEPVEEEPEEVEVEVLQKAPKAPKVEGIQPQRAMDLLGVLLPQKLDFVRSPLGETPDVVDQTMPIYGSVSKADIVQKIRSLLSHNDEAARIRLEESDIEFVDVKLDDPTRVKHLGMFNVKILLKGSDQWPVERKVQVVAQGES